MSQRRVVRRGLTATLQTAAAVTAKMDGTSAENFKVPPKAKRLIAIEYSMAHEAALAITENNIGLRLQGDGLPGGPYFFVLGAVITSGTTSGQSSFIAPSFKIETDIPVNSNGPIDGDLFPDGDTITVAYVMVALVFEE